MTDAKLEIKVGTVSFTGEGPGEWLSKQLDKVLAKLPELAAVHGLDTDSENGDADGGSGKMAVASKPKGKRPILAAFLNSLWCKS